MGERQAIALESGLGDGDVEEIAFLRKKLMDFPLVNFAMARLMLAMGPKNSHLRPPHETDLCVFLLNKITINLFEECS